MAFLYTDIEKNLATLPLLSAHPKMPSAAPFFWPLLAIGSLMPMIFIQALPPPIEECIFVRKPWHPHFRNLTRA